MFDLLIMAIVLAVGFVGGVHWYGYTLKNDPAKLARILDEVSQKRDVWLSKLDDKVKEKLKDLVGLK
jgi:hypothetical protein